MACQSRDKDSHHQHIPLLTYAPTNNLSNHLRMPIGSSYATTTPKSTKLQKKSSGVQFLVHMGACGSLLPRLLSRRSRCLPNSAGIHLVPVNIPVTPIHNQKFLVADVTLAILGVDLLSHSQLLVVVAHRLLVNSDMYSSTPLQPTTSNLALHLTTHMDAYANLLMSYPKVFHLKPYQTLAASAKHGIYHHIKIMGLPLFTRFRHLAEDRLALLNKHSPKW
ncbi:uncharacterized protein [Palaemon carinicauda]|uniref:uncharacterized protein n=1 Tax=Palaemon carinicauda TaxID=392227 RepID=UPI0035B5E9DC